jgi:hypothetical protein
MQTKLTLRLEEELIQQAKEYAKQQNKSLSQIVGDYFRMLSRQTESSPLPPITQSLTGILKGHRIDKDDYKHYLRGKYL